MALTSLSLENVRNLASQKIELSSHVNLISGANGSGKTSLLEAIYLLGRARSFRTRFLRQVIFSDADNLTVVGKFSSFQPHALTTVGFNYDKQKKATVRFDGKQIRTSAQLAAHFPLLFLSSHTGKLLSSGEKQRRRCLDWGVFHVEHGFHSAWQRYQQALKQRNAALQMKSKDMTLVWTQELAATAEEITRYRSNYLQQLSPIFFNTVEELTENTFKVSKLSFERGWTKSVDSYAEYLDVGYEKDSKAGYTQRGPHRADIKLDIEQGALSQYGSGGQQKLVTCALLLSQVILFQQITGKSCTLLVDDLPAELDAHYRRVFMTYLMGLKSQVFITATELDLVQDNAVENQKMFHVEHGKISEIKA